MFKLVCRPCQSMLIGLKDSYHNLASTNIRQNLWTFTPSWNWCVSIQLLVLSKWTSASPSVFPENSGLKCAQFNYGICYAGCCSTGGVEVLVQLVLVVLHLPYVFCTMHASLILYTYFIYIFILSFLLLLQVNLTCRRPNKLKLLSDSAKMYSNSRMFK